MQLFGGFCASLSSQNFSSNLVHASKRWHINASDSLTNNNPKRNQNIFQKYIFIQFLQQRKSDFALKRTCLFLLRDVFARTIFFRLTTDNGNDEFRHSIRDSNRGIKKKKKKNIKRKKSKEVTIYHMAIHGTRRALIANIELNIGVGKMSRHFFMTFFYDILKLIGSTAVFNTHD